MDYGWPYPRRKKFLAELQTEKSDRNHPVPFQGSLKYLGIYSVPLDLPLYRLENGRTTDRQAEYLAQHAALPPNFFRADIESMEAQRVQHSLLVALSRESKNLFAEFKTEKQMEPIILSAQGVVINGNRRLSTWRQLYQDSPKIYGHFSNIDVVILPQCDERDLDKLEATLQLEEDLKAEYSWTSQALMYREKRDQHGYTEAELAAKYEIDPQELKELFDSLDYANAYLESRGTPQRYSELEGKEFAFRQISRTRKRIKQSEPLKEVFEKASFCLADEAAEGKRTYAEIKVVGDHLEKVTENLIDAFDLTSAGDEAAQITALSKALDAPENFDAARASIRDTLDAEGAKKRQKKKLDYVVEQIRKAKESLQSAKESIETTSARAGGIQLLDQIDKLVNELKVWAKSDGE